MSLDIIFDIIFIRRVIQCGTEKFRVEDAYHLCEIVDRTESDENALISPREGHEKGSLVPHSTDVVPEIS